MKLIYQQMRLLLVGPKGAGLGVLSDHLAEFRFANIFTAADLEAAMAILNREAVNLVISALYHESKGDFPLLKALADDPRLANLPVLVLLDRREEEPEKRAAEMGASGFINLPLEPQGVKSTVRQMLEPYINPAEEEFLQQMSRAKAALEEGDQPQAIEAYGLALEAKFDVRASLALAALLFKTGDLDGAEDQYAAVIQADPQMLKAYLGLALVHKAQARLEHAATVLDSALAAARGLKDTGKASATILLYLGEIELALKHLNLAKGHFTRACELDPENRDLRVRIGDALTEGGHAAEAEDYYKEALKLDPEVAHIYNRLGIAYRKQGKYGLALKLYRRALTFHTEDEHLLYNTALCLWEMEDLPQAAEFLETALKLNPGFGQAKRFLKLVRHKMGPGQDGQPDPAQTGA